MTTAARAPERRGAARGDAGNPRLATYDVQVRTAVSPALAAALPVRVTRSIVPRRGLFRLLVADRDLARVVERVHAAGADLVDIHLVPRRG